MTFGEWDWGTGDVGIQLRRRTKLGDEPKASNKARRATLRHGTRQKLVDPAWLTVVTGNIEVNETAAETNSACSVDHRLPDESFRPFHTDQTVQDFVDFHQLPPAKLTYLRCTRVNERSALRATGNSLHVLAAAVTAVARQQHSCDRLPSLKRLSRKDPDIAGILAFPRVRPSPKL